MVELQHAVVEEPAKLPTLELSLRTRHTHLHILLCPIPIRLSFPTLDFHDVLYIPHLQPGLCFRPRRFTRSRFSFCLCSIESLYILLVSSASLVSQNPAYAVSASKVSRAASDRLFKCTTYRSEIQSVYHGSSYRYARSYDLIDDFDRLCYPDG